MNLARVLFKKHHDDQHLHEQLDQPSTAPQSKSERQSPTRDVAAEGSPTTRSPRRKTRSTPSRVGGDSASLKSASDTQLPRPLHHTTIFKAIKMSTHKRFAQVLPNLLLGICYTYIHTSLFGYIQK